MVLLFISLFCQAELESLRARLSEPGLVERLVKKVGRIAVRRVSCTDRKTWLMSSSTGALKAF